MKKGGKYVAKTGKEGLVRGKNEAWLLSYNVK
jgi:hypothetical protein